MMYITEECINCSACNDECDNNAIYNAGDNYVLNDETLAALSNDFSYIVPELCDNCKSCVEVCAVDAIVEK